jgi:hypothetical protein
MFITRLCYEAFSSQMSRIWKETTSKNFWSQDRLKAALAAVRSGRKLLEICRQFHIHKATLRQWLKINPIGCPKIGRSETEEQKRNLCDHILQLSDMFMGILIQLQRI